MTVFAPPATDEYGAAYAGYIARVPAGSSILELLAAQGEEHRARLRALPEARGAYRYAPGKWSVREVVLHLADTERIMAYRALRMARGDATPLPGFDENAYVPLSGAEEHPLPALLDEWSDVRRATLSLFGHLTADAWLRRGTASGFHASPRGLAWIIAGHERHHMATLGERYGLWSSSSPSPGGTR